MRRIETFAHVRPFLVHEVDACRKLGVPVDSGIVMCNAEGSSDPAFNPQSDRHVEGLTPGRRGKGRTAVVDIREKRGAVKTQQDFTNCYWGVGQEDSQEGPEYMPLPTVTREIASPALNDFLSGRDVCLAAVGARMSGKTQLLFGDHCDDAAQPSESVLSYFASSLWEALGGEDCDDSNQVVVSAIEILPDGKTLNLLGDSGPIEDGDDTGIANTFVGPIPGVNALLEVVLNVFFNVEQLRGSGTPRGTTVISLRVDRTDSANVSNSPVAMFVEIEPFSANTRAPKANAIRKLARQLSEEHGGGAGNAIAGDDDALVDPLPWGIGLLLEALSGRGWATRVLACLSPSLTALTTSCHTLNLVSQFHCDGEPASKQKLQNGPREPKAVDEPTPMRRDVSSMLAFTPDTPSACESPQENPRPREKPPVAMHEREGVRMPSTGSLLSNTPASSTPQHGPEGVPKSSLEESVCTELIGLVKMLKTEIELLRTELNDERKRHATTKEEHQVTVASLGETIEGLQREIKERDGMLKESAVKVEMAQTEKRSYVRELRLREEERESLLYENQALHRFVDARGHCVEATSPPRQQPKKSKSPVAHRVTRAAVGGRAGYCRQVSHVSASSRSNSPATTRGAGGKRAAQPGVGGQQPRSRTPPSRTAASTHNSSAAAGLPDAGAKKARTSKSGASAE